MAKIWLINSNGITIPLRNESVHCVVTSPPYWGLRDYGLPPLIWGGEVGCRHVWGSESKSNQRIRHGSDGGLFDDGRVKRDLEQLHPSTGQFCQLCNAWLGCLGLEPTPELYVQHLVEVFREVWRVLRRDGTVWLNLGDSYSTGIGANFTNLLHERIKEGIVFIGPGCSLTITSKRDGILEDDKLPPDQVFLRLFGIKRILVKEGNENLRQILNGLAPIADCRISASIVATINQADAEVILDSVDDILIIVSDHNLDTNPAFKVPLFAGTTKDSKTALTIEEASEPMPERIGYVQSAGDTISPDALRKCFPKVNLVDKSISLTETSMPHAEPFGDFSITKANAKHLALTLMDGRIKLAFRSVAHLFVSNSYGSFVSYAELYYQAQQLSNERQAKQELGIPDMVIRALMRDGWIKRSTIIWHKPNCMPESVRDRPTTSHEYLFLLAKSKRYFYDGDAIREPQTGNTHSRGKGNTPKDAPAGSGIKGNESFNRAMAQYTEVPGGRNKRTVWTIPTKPYKGAHFATFPPALVEPCIKAGTSERGVCPECGAQWGRVISKPKPPPEVFTKRNAPTDELICSGSRIDGKMVGHGQKLQDWLNANPPTTTGWQPTCTCDAGEPIPATVLDPFAGSGTTNLVARGLGRRSIGLDLSFAYLRDQARTRLELDRLAEWENGKRVEANWKELPLFRA